jgi:hypothetical protein
MRRDKISSSLGRTKQQEVTRRDEEECQDRGDGEPRHHEHRHRLPQRTAGQRHRCEPKNSGGRGQQDRAKTLFRRCYDGFPEGKRLALDVDLVDQHDGVVDDDAR